MLQLRSVTSIRPIRAALMAGAALIAQPAYAQAQQADEPATASQETLDDVIVTASRREQRLQDVGVAVTALGSETLSNLSVTTSSDIVRAVPSLKMNTYSSAAVVYNIRGLAQNDYGDQQEPPVAVYQDDSYASSLNFAGFPVFDLERVEVLRGPQGTLFGRNATGGAIQFISKKPSRQFEADAGISYGSYNQTIVQGAISGPVSDSVQLRLAGIVNKSDGYLENISPGGADQGGNNNWAMRGTLAWQPSDSADVLLTLRYGRNDHERQAGQYSWEAAAPNADGQGVYLPADVDFFGTGPGADASGYRNDAINYQRGGDPYKIAANNHDSFVDREVYGGTLRVETELGEGLTLTSITDYQHGEKFYAEDGDASPNDLVYFYQGSEIDQYSQEVRLAGELGRNTWTAGAFGMVVDGEYSGGFTLPLYDYFPVAAFTQKTTSYAFFLQNEFAATDQLKFILGARYWHDNRKVDYQVTDGAVSIVFNDRTISPAVPGLSPDAADRGFDDFTLKAEVDYKPTEDILLYLSYNRGSKSGGFTLPLATPLAGNEPDFINGFAYRPETLHAFEAGVKATIAPRTTLNAAAFYYDYRDYQAFAQYGPVQTVVNLDATVKGLEVELNSRPVTGLTLQVGTSLLDTEVKDVPLPGGRFTNRNLPQAPEFSGNALIRYEYPVSAGSLSIQADAQYTGDFCFSTLCAPVEQEESYALLNGRVAFAADAGWELALYVNNITDETYRVYAVDIAATGGFAASIYGRPRTWGLSATMAFGN